MIRASGLHPVAVELRREVGFRCPATGCDSLLLTYHHFDPPWAEKNHNNPEGMIALCPTCHVMAEGGHWTKEDLRELKKTCVNQNLRGMLRSTLPRSSVGVAPFYRLGSTYSSNCPIILSIGGMPIIWERVSEDGIPLISVRVFDVEGNLILAVDENSVAVETALLWDIHFAVGGSKITVRKKKREECQRSTTVLRMRIDRLHPTEFENQLRATASLDIVESQTHEFDFEMLGLPHFDMASVSNDHIVNMVNYAKKHCSDVDGNIFVITFERAHLYARGRLLAIRRGKPILDEQSLIHNNFAAGCGGAYALHGSQRLLRRRNVLEHGAFNVNTAKVLVMEKLFAELQGRSTVDKLDGLYTEASSLYPAVMQVAAVALVAEDAQIQQLSGFILESRRQARIGAEGD